MTESYSADMNDAATNLAKNLRDGRERRGFTQAQLARLCGLPRSTVALLETGAANPTLAVLTQVCGALQISLEELLTPPHGRRQLFRRGELPIRQRGGCQLEHLLP